MLAYHLRLALRSLWRNPVLTALMIGAIAIGIGVCMTTLSIYYLMSSNPIPHKSDVLHAVQLDSWDPAQGYSEDNFPGLPPWELTYRDAMALRRSDIPVRQAAMFKTAFIVQPELDDVQPFLVVARSTDGDFFPLFDVPFLHGSGWDQRADERGEFVVVLGREVNDKVFGGEDSVGRRIKLDDHYFEVTGVLDDWSPSPLFYDVNNGAFDSSEDIYVPFGLVDKLQLEQVGNVNCWKSEHMDSRRAFLNSECVWIQYWAELESRDQRQRYRDFLDGYVMQQKALGRFERPLNNRLTPVQEWLDVRRVVRDDNKVLVGLSFMFLAVCLFNTVGLLLAKFVGKAPQIGLRRALGASKAVIFQQHLIEVGLVGLVGGAFGVALAWLGLQGVRRLYQGSDSFAYLDLNMLAAGFGIALASSILAGLYPTWRVCRMPPAPFLKTQ